MDAGTSPWALVFTTSVRVNTDDGTAELVVGGYETDPVPADPTQVPDSDLKRKSSTVQEFEETI